MILKTSLIGGWEKLELWGQTHSALFGLLVLVCILEVILLKMTTSSRLFTRPHHYDPDYDYSGEYEEDIYYEDLQANNEQWLGRQQHTDHRQHEQEHQISHHHQQQQQQQRHQQQRHFNNDNYSTDRNNYLRNNLHTNTTDVLRFVY